MRVRLPAAIFLAALFLGAPAAQTPPPGVEPEALMPPIPPAAIFEEVLSFRAEVEARIDASRAAAKEAAGLLALVDSLGRAWERFGVRLEEEHGSFPNLSRNRPYWLLITDDAADTLVDRLGSVVAGYVQAHPEEKLGPMRAEWELRAERLGVPRTKIFGFQVVELARRSALLRGEMEEAYPDQADVIRDASIRFLWDLVQFYRQLHGTWFERHQLRVAQEDWVVRRLEGRCEDPQWRLAMSYTAIGVDTSRYDPMSDVFMHRLVVIDPACPETVDFVVFLPHFRLMEQELLKMSETERHKQWLKLQGDR